MALARYWEWERAVERDLPRVISEGEIQTLFQPIYRISHGLPVARGFEALSRFPASPRIPLGLWFRIARELDLARDLEMAAVRAAIRSLVRVPGEAFLCVNASLGSVPELVEIIPRSLHDKLIIDLPYSAVRDSAGEEMFGLLRGAHAGVAIDDVPLEDLHALQPVLSELRPDCIKVDVLTGLADSPMARFNLAEGSAWCLKVGITLIAERVERVADLTVLEAVGVEWAQGYSLSRPVDL